MPWLHGHPHQLVTRFYMKNFFCTLRTKIRGPFCAGKHPYCQAPVSSRSTTCERCKTQNRERRRSVTRDFPPQHQGRRRSVTRAVTRDFPLRIVLK
jgi:hypothetical protein